MTVIVVRQNKKELLDWKCDGNHENYRSQLSSAAKVHYGSNRPIRGLPE